MKVGRINSSQDGIVFDVHGEVQALSAGHGNVPKILTDEENKNTGGGVKQINTSKESGGQQPFMQNRIYDADGIVPALSQLSDRMNIKVKSATKDGYETASEGDSINLSLPNSKTRRGRVGVGVAQTLDTQANQAIVLPQKRIRRLTPLECMRLQGFPDSFIKPCSDTQIYKQAGNSITVPVLKAIIKNILSAAFKD